MGVLAREPVLVEHLERVLKALHRTAQLLRDVVTGLEFCDAGERLAEVRLRLGPLDGLPVAGPNLERIEETGRGVAASASPDAASCRYTDPMLQRVAAQSFGARWGVRTSNARSNASMARRRLAVRSSGSSVGSMAHALPRWLCAVAHSLLRDSRDQISNAAA